LRRAEGRRKGAREHLCGLSGGTALDLTEQNVKVRLHRGPAMLRGWLAYVGTNAKNAFPFMGARAAMVLSMVFFRRLAELSTDHLQIQ
jgi:RNA polymerase sigma-70 factor (ECF subfamily)